MTRNEAVKVWTEKWALATGYDYKIAEEASAAIDIYIALGMLEVDEPEDDDFAYNTAVEVLDKCRRGASPEELITALNDAGVFLAALSDLK